MSATATAVADAMAPAVKTSPSRAARRGRATRLAFGLAVISSMVTGRPPLSISARIWSSILICTGHSHQRAQLCQAALDVVLDACLLNAGELRHFAVRVAVAVHEHYGEPLPPRTGR